MSKIVVLGANSFIARNLIYCLLRDRKHTVLSLYDGKERQLDDIESYKQIDILDAKSVSEVDMDCDAIFMFIGKAGSLEGFNDFQTFIDVNERALLNVLSEYRRQKSNAKIIFPSTRLVYKGNAGQLKEDAEKEFKTIYAINKYACEQYLEQYNRVYNIKYCIFRICIPYGTLIPQASSYGTAEFMLRKAQSGSNIPLYGGGLQRRTLTYIEDLCNSLIVGADSEQCINSCYNIGGEDYSLREMAGLIADRYGVSVDDVAWPQDVLSIESGDTVFDSSKFDGIGIYKRKMAFATWCKSANLV